jgi:V/A-type H+-transporting ATPase subunit D
MAEIIPTRGAALALAEEKRFIETGYEFLDEKRMLLASTLLAELDHWRAARARYDARQGQAVAALKAAIARHGVAALLRYPAPAGAAQGLSLVTYNFLGLGLIKPPTVSWAGPGPVVTLDASTAAEDCRDAFAALLPLAIEVAVHAANIRRLIREYRATERRARALENVILPETVANLAAITEYLDESDQEEALRIRNARRDR